MQVTEFKETDLLTNQVITHTRREYVPSLEEQARARERIFKVNGAYSEKRELEHSGSVIFVDDVPLDDHD